MRVTRKKTSLLCRKCKGLETKAQFEKIYEGKKDASILIIKCFPAYEECAQGKFFVSEAGRRFRFMFQQHVCPLEQCLIVPMIRCSSEPRLANVRKCSGGVELALKRERKVIICLGRLVLKHVFMRGATPPPLDILLGRITRMPEQKAAIITLPEVEDLLLVEQNPTDFRYNPAKELQMRSKQMNQGLLAVVKALEE